MSKPVSKSINKSAFFGNSFFFYLLLAILLHGLLLLIPHLSIPAAADAPSAPITVAYTRVKTVQDSPEPHSFPEQIESAAAPAPVVNSSIRTTSDKQDAVKKTPLADVPTGEADNQPFTLEPLPELTAADDTGADTTEDTAAGSAEAQDLLNPDLPLWQEINRKVKMASSYPPLARKRGLEGLALVFFELDDTGQLKYVELVQSTGHELLDKAAVAAVRRITPFKHSLGKSIRVQLPVRYRLEK